MKEFDVILWDFDGVIMDSMSIRDKGFEVTLSSFPKDKVEALLEYHRINGGLSRYHKFRYFYENILGIGITEEEIFDLASKFSDIMMDLLIDESLLIEDSLSFIKRNYKHVPMHIVSGSDGKELNKICSQLNISKYFKSIQGSPTPKKDLVASLIDKEEYRGKNIVLIGDSINDFEAAEVNKISFMAYNNNNLKVAKYAYINAFSEIDI